MSSEISNTYWRGQIRDVDADVFGLHGPAALVCLKKQLPHPFVRRAEEVL